VPTFKASHQNLKIVFTEQAAAWLQRYLELADILLNGKGGRASLVTQIRPMMVT